MLSKELLESIIVSCKTDKQIIKVLQDNKIPFTDDSKEYEFFNIHIQQNDLYFRIYKRKREYIVQKQILTRFEYSRIPTFFSSNSYF